MDSEIRVRLNSGAMSLFQLRAISICLLVNALDGFDIMVIAYVAPVISEDWSLAAEQLGILFSAGLAGMTLGSLLLSPFADVYGRRPTILLCLVVVSAGMVVSAYAQTLTQLALFRLVTGLGIGMMLPSITMIVGELSSDQRRATAISLSMAGYPIGAILGGGLTVYLLQQFDWQTVFIVGGVITGLTLPLVYLYVPESLEFMGSRQSGDSLARINKLLVKMGKEPLTALPPASVGQTVVVSRVTSLLRHDLRRSTVLVWACFFLVMSTMYFGITWTPQAMVASGFDVSRGVSVGVLIQVGSLLGVFILGLLTTRIKIHSAACLLMLTGFLAMIVFSAALPFPEVLSAVAVLVGIGTNASIIALYAIIPGVYPVSVRVTAMGWAIGVGRLSAVLTPYVAGLLRGFGLEFSSLYLLFAVPILGAAGLVLLIPRTVAASGAGSWKSL